MGCKDVCCFICFDNNLKSAKRSWKNQLCTDWIWAWILTKHDHVWLVITMNLVAKTSNFQEKRQLCKVTRDYPYNPIFGFWPIDYSVNSCNLYTKIKKGNNQQNIVHKDCATPSPVLFMSFLSGLSNYVWFNWIWLQQGMCKN